ncbi:hypothetical protein GUJ93_ZPchr0006g46010 [Zizania palustris]|uniref:Uncharacterized protein n=1 Tax=Zizania palustris TaxID=103762 RepID=A0A8J5W3M2_ZIZPA|nr:hypothetical protein GUJ93_ZPchr0006g46010 [Zizania palustris]
MFVSRENTVMYHKLVKKSVLGRWVIGSMPILMSFFLTCVSQKLLISLSVRLGICFAIADHLVQFRLFKTLALRIMKCQARKCRSYLMPRTEWSWRMVCSSSCENFPLLMSSFREFVHLILQQVQESSSPSLRPLSSQKGGSPHG